MWRTIFVLQGLLGSNQGLVNLLKNPGFEQEIKGTWEINGFKVERVTGDVMEGQYAMKGTGRDKEEKGPYQNLENLKPGARYEGGVFIKLLNDPGRLFQQMKIVLQFYIPSTDESIAYLLANRGLTSSLMGWIGLNGSCNAPARDFSSGRFAVRGPDANADILVDDAFLYEIPENTNWLSDSHTGIDKHRKSNVKIGFTLPPGAPASAFDIQIRLKKHLFPFGGKMKDMEVIAQPFGRYLNFSVYLFNWAAIQSFKWKYDKGDRYNPNFSNALNATIILLSRGMKVRGHSVFWDIDKNIPDWVLTLKGQELRDELDKHLYYMCNLARGLLLHWDVQNEHTHGQYYEEMLNDRNLTKKFYRMMRECDKDVKLFFNDFQGVDTGGSTEEYYQLLKQYMAEGVPVQGLGVQGHVKMYMRPDPTMIWRRLDRLGMLGIDIVMSEFDIAAEDHIERADWVEDAMRAFFSHPAMTHIIFWSFWDLDSGEPYKELVQGNEIIIIEPGQRFVCLVKKEWSTNIDKNLGAGQELSFRAFRGDYEVVVKRSGVPVQVSKFSVGHTETKVNIVVTSNTAPVTVVEEEDYVPKCISHRGMRLIGEEVGSETDVKKLICVTASSEASGGKEGDVVSISCDKEYVMTDCMSTQINLSWMRQGEQIVFEDDVYKCKAYNGRNSASGVKAVARCCKDAGLTCTYMEAGPSSPMKGAQAEAICPERTKPLGCTSYSQYPDMEGVFLNLTANSCVAQSGNPASAIPGERSGSFVTAACCSAELNCTREMTSMTDLKASSQKSLICPSNGMMVSCDYFAADGRAVGAKIEETNGVAKCVVVLGDNLPAGSKGVVGTATCCDPYVDIPKIKSNWNKWLWQNWEDENSWDDEDYTEAPSRAVGTIYTTIYLLIFTTAGLPSLLYP